MAEGFGKASGEMADCFINLYRGTEAGFAGSSGEFPKEVGVEHQLMNQVSYLYDGVEVFHGVSDCAVNMFEIVAVIFLDVETVFDFSALASSL